jgi:hypothetical protein
MIAFVISFIDVEVIVLFRDGFLFFANIKFFVHPIFIVAIVVLEML